MLTTDVQERIISVFDRATKSLYDEFREITLTEPSKKRINLYKDIESDFKSYSVLGEDLVAEVKSNISANLRPSERIKYVNNLSNFLSQVKDRYAYLESDEWLDQIFVNFGNLIVFNNIPKVPKLTEEDKKGIFKVAEEVRVCCYEYVKAVEKLNAESADPLPQMAMNMGYFSNSQTVVASRQEKYPSSTAKETQQINTTGTLQWKGDKTDLAELVWSLFKSNRITDTTTGQPVTQKELTRQIETLLCVTNLDVTGLMKGRMKTYKATSDGNTFTKTLCDLVVERAANS